MLHTNHCHHFPQISSFPSSTFSWPFLQPGEGKGTAVREIDSGHGGTIIKRASQKYYFQYSLFHSFLHTQREGLLWGQD